MLTAEDRQVAAETLFDAQKDAEACVQPSGIWPDLTLDDAYDIQNRLIALKTTAGARTVGHKIAVATVLAQRAYGVTDPIAGVVFDDGLTVPGTVFTTAQCIAPKVGVGLAFVLRSDLGAGTQVEDVLAATQHVTPALDIADARTEAPSGLADIVADNAGFGAMVLADVRIDPAQTDVAWISATLAVNGVIAHGGVSSLTGGSPAATIAWLANMRASTGGGLKSGDIVLAGAFVGPVAVRLGDRVTADFGPWGRLDVGFGG